jgi:hypothetical protein
MQTTCARTAMSVKDLAGMSRDAGVPSGFQGCHLIKLNGYVFVVGVPSDAKQ